MERFETKKTVTERFQEQCIEAHNHFRALHGISRLRWSDDLAKRAQYWAQKIADIGFVLYQEDPEIGENISVIDKEDMPEARGDLLTRMWYDEIQFYDFDKPGWRRETTHFSQMMWRNSIEMGCFFVKTKIKGIKSMVVIAMYKPAGNSNKPGQFKENVPQPKYRVRYREHQASGLKSSASQTKLPTTGAVATTNQTVTAISNGNLLNISNTPVHQQQTNRPHFHTPHHQLYHHSAYAPASQSPAANAMATPGRHRRHMNFFPSTADQNLEQHQQQQLRGPVVAIAARRQQHQYQHYTPVHSSVHNPTSRSEHNLAANNTSSSPAVVVPHVTPVKPTAHTPSRRIRYNV